MVTETGPAPDVGRRSGSDSHRHGLIGAILDIAVRFRWAVIVLTVFAAIYGAMNLLRLPIDAVPDITNTQVQINTSAPALSPSQVETQVTFPIETGLAGIEEELDLPAPVQGDLYSMDDVAEVPYLSLIHI